MDPTPDILNQNHWSWRHRIVRSKISTGDSDDQPGWRTTDGENKLSVFREEKWL